MHYFLQVLMIFFGFLLHSSWAYRKAPSLSKSYRRKLSLAGFEGYQQPATKVGAFPAARDSHPNFPTIILVNPHIDQNVGSVARTMLNFGLTDLRIVDPVCDIYNDNVRALSSGAFELVENAKVYSTAEEAVQDLTRVMATTIRPRHLTTIVHTPNKAAEEALLCPGKVGILFGRERNGLTNEEVALADAVISIPTFNQFSSLNLAQAVNIIGYEIFSQYQRQQESHPPDIWLHPKDGERLARRDDMEPFFQRLENALDVRLQQDEHRKQLAYRSLRGMFQRIMMTKSEVDLMHGVITLFNRPLPTSSLSKQQEKREEGEVTEGDLAMSKVEKEEERVQQ
eukprot:gene3237-3546_t